jgi:hypothetical protein
MSDKPNGFQAGTMFCVPLGPVSAGEIAYLPGAPRLDLDDGEPRITLMHGPDGGFLACETIWHATDAELAAAERAILSRHPDLALLDLHIADLADAEARLIITPEAGEALTIGPEMSSGSPSYRALFSASLEPAQAEAVAAALEGEPGRMILEYRASLDLKERVAAELAGDLGARARTLLPEPDETRSGDRPQPECDPAPDLDTCRAAIGDALENGELVLTRRHSANAPAAARDAMEAELREAAAHRLHDALAEGEMATLAVATLGFQRKASRTVFVSFALHDSADLAQTRHDGNGPEPSSP